MVLRRFALLTGILLLDLIFWFVDPANEHLMAKTLFALAGPYFIFTIALEQYTFRRVEGRRTRHGLRKVLTAMYVLISLGAAFAIWVQDPDAVAAFIGLIGAAVAFVLQDFLKSLVGGFAMFASNIHSVGDRSQIMEKRGDVVDIGRLYITLPGIRERVDGDQVTGRLTSLPNGFVSTNMVDNYAEDFPCVWEEVSSPIAIDIDLGCATGRFQRIAEDEAAEASRGPGEALTGMVMEEYHLDRQEVRPSMHVTFNDDWAVMYVRYIVRVRERRLKCGRLFHLCLEGMQASDRIRLGSDARGIDAFPEVRVVMEPRRMT